MAAQLPPIGPILLQPPEADEITDGVYIIGWRLRKNLKDQLEDANNLALTPAVEVASVSNIVPLVEGAKLPVLVKPIIDGIQPAGQYWHIQRRIDSDGRFTIKPFKGAEDATTFNDNNKLVVQGIFIPPEWNISRITPGVPLYSIIEPGSERVWAYPKDGNQVLLEEFAKVMESKKLTHLLYLIKVADDNSRA